MANLSITQAWNETSGFVQREARLLFPIAFLLIALPSGLLQLFLPTPTASPAEQSEALLRAMPFWVVAVILAMIGTIALSYLALRPGASVGEALQVGGRRFLMLFLASLLIGIGAIILFVPLILLIGGSAVLNGSSPEALAGPILLAALVVAVAAIAVWARLMLMTPVTAAEAAGPIGIITRSWELTSGHFWKLIGLILLLGVLFLVLSMVVGAIAGILIFMTAGRPDPGSFSAFLVMLIGALLNMVVTVYFTVLVSKIYAQLTGAGREKVFT